MTYGSEACAVAAGGGGSDGSRRSVFRSSRTNKDIADKNYPDDPVQGKVATWSGDEIPKMRDDLIDRKNKGEGPIERHVKAWSSPKNWEVDPDNDEKERNDPAEP